ncbi:MAG TPA: hypothetical protein VJS91_04590 [Nitrososphaeraceae archaeon]|nr:hypothetical protein [Nitrososphaeraceae archaeon]
MLNTKNVLLLVMLSAGLLTAVTGTGISMLSAAFAIEDNCEENDNDSCQEQNQKVHQENNCKIVDKSENVDKGDTNTNTNVNSGDKTCWDFAQNPVDGEAAVNEFPPNTLAPTIADEIPSDPFAIIT